MSKIKKTTDTVRFSIGFKINVVFGIIILLFIFFSLYNRKLLNRFSNTYTDQTEIYYSISRLKDDFAYSDMVINEYLKNGNKTNLADFNGISSKLRLDLQAMSLTIKSDEASYLLRSIRNSFDTYYSECCGASFLYNTNDYDYYRRMYYAQNINDYLLRYCDELLELIVVDTMVSNQLLMEQHTKLTYLNLGIIIFIVLLFFVCVVYVNLNITRPLNALLTQAEELSKGNLDVKVPEGKLQSTVSILSKTFNHMAQNIKTMMESIQENIKIEKALLDEQRKNIEYQTLLNQATFLALQSQINPHFLFNTLNSISRMITLKKEEQAIIMINSLSMLLRYSLSDGQIPVTLAQEIMITEEYLRIQSFRFSDRIRSNIRYENNLVNDIILPKFTLQPIVENAIIHGLESKEDGGDIVITAKRRGKYNIIKIGDNGVGISKEKLKGLRDNNLKTTSKSIGLKNTQNRIQIFTSKKDSFRIISKKNKGTVITIKLLAEEGEGV